MIYPSLLVSLPVLLGTDVILDLTHVARGWRRPIGLQGGCGIGSFSLYPGDGGLSLMDLKNIFHEFSGYHFTERVGALKSWAGMWYELDLTLNGHTKRRSLEKTKNRIKAAYTNTSDATVETSWYENTDSQAVFGKIEEILKLDSYNQTEAETRVQSDLKKMGWPYPVGAGMGLNTDNKLEVRIAGYAVTCNHRYITATAAADDDADDWIGEIAAADCELISAGRIETNTAQVWKNPKVPQRAWDTMKKIALIGDYSFNPWRVHVDEERQLHYEAVDLDYAYLTSNEGGVWRVYGASGEEINPWLIQPGVFRDISYPVSPSAEPGTPFLEDIRDELIDEVEIGSDGQVYLKPADADEIDILVAQQEYLKEIERDKS